MSSESEEAKVQVLPLHNPSRVWKQVQQREQPVASQFRTVPGPYNTTPLASPASQFLDFLSDDVVGTFCTATNKYARLLYDNERRRKSRQRMWEDVGLQEMRAFLGVVFLMGIEHQALLVDKGDDSTHQGSLNYFRESVFS